MNSFSLGLGGYTIVFGIAAILLVVILCAIFVFRQIQRVRLNSARREVNSSIAPEVSKKSRHEIRTKIEAVGAYRINHYPKFTDINAIPEHADKPYVNRMIGFDEINRHVDRQLEVINSTLIRLPGESTNLFLRFIRDATGLPIDDIFIARLSFFHEICRYRTQVPFLDSDLEELRSMLKKFTKILNNNLARLAKPADRKRIPEEPKTNSEVKLKNNRKPTKSKKKQVEEIQELLPTDPGMKRRQNAQAKMAKVMVNNEEDIGVGNFVRSREGEVYFKKLEERIKEHKRKKLEQKLSESIIPPPDKVEKISLDSGQVLRSFSDSSSSVFTNAKNSSTKPTASTSPGPLLSPLPSKPPISLINSNETQTGIQEADNGFQKIVSGLWVKMKDMIGITKDCLNGGTKRLNGKCHCPEYFLGDFCERRQCLNNGVIVKIQGTIPQEETCKCPHPQYITGNHCEKIHCQNGGKPFDNGTCKCIDNWYTGEFCEYYATSWFAVLGVPLICIAIIALCCVICRLDFCPKRSQRNEHRRRNRGPIQTRRPNLIQAERHRHRFDDPQTLMIQENLLNDCQQHLNNRNQVVRLENIPVYNPRIPSMPNDEFKPLEPPPSYEQAVSSCPSLNVQQTSQMPQPPTYTAQDNRQVPPPPEFSPPNPPANQYSNSRSRRS